MLLILRIINVTLVLKLLLIIFLKIILVFHVLLILIGILISKDAYLVSLRLFALQIDPCITPKLLDVNLAHQALNLMIHSKNVFPIVNLDIFIIILAYHVKINVLHNNSLILLAIHAKIYAILHGYMRK